jgi:hypothetical protein
MCVASNQHETGDLGLPLKALIPGLATTATGNMFYLLSIE